MKHENETTRAAIRDKDRRAWMDGFICLLQISSWIQY